MVNRRSVLPAFFSRYTPAHGLGVRLRRITVLTALILLFVSPVLAWENTPEDAELKSSGGAETFFYSRYVSRGIALSDGPVFQPSAWLTLADFTLSYFGNYVLTKEKQQGRFNEADTSLAWVREWNRFIIEPKFTLYPPQHRGSIAV